MNNGTNKYIARVGLIIFNYTEAHHTFLRTRTIRFSNDFINQTALLDLSLTPSVCIILYFIASPERTGSKQRIPRDLQHHLTSSYALVVRVHVRRMNIFINGNLYVTLHRSADAAVRVIPRFRRFHRKTVSQRFAPPPKATHLYRWWPGPRVLRINYFAYASYLRLSYLCVVRSRPFPAALAL